MGFYSEVIFPLLYDRLMNRRKDDWNKYRQEQLASVDGEVLEIGVGTGLNLPHYPGHIRKITTVDPNRGMNRRLERRLKSVDIEIDRRIVSSEELPFENASFDCVVSTLTLCSIPAVDQAVAELFRVLKPGGSFFFLEHGVCENPRIAKWQRRMNWLQRRIGDGCRLDVDIRRLLESQPFSSLELSNFYMEGMPKIAAYMYRGVATK